MFAVDDGLTSGNLNLADVCFLIALILAGLAGIAYAVVQPPAARWAPVLLSFAVALISLGFFVL